MLRLLTSGIPAKNMVFVRKSSFTNQNDAQISVQLIDGIQNILPQGVEPDLQKCK